MIKLIWLQAAVPRVGDAREDWKILRALSEVLGKPLPYSSLQDVQRRMTDLAPHLGRVDAVESPLWLNGEYFKVCPSALQVACMPTASGESVLRFSAGQQLLFAFTMALGLSIISST